MRIINRNAIKDYMIHDIEMLLACTNDDVKNHCKKQGWDVYDFIQHIEDE